jgi:hypothetical protein
LKEDKKLSQQVLIYFISEALVGSKKYYSEMKKDMLCSGHERKEAHRIRVLTNQPLNDIFGNHDSSCRIAKWAIELSEYVIDFEKRSAIKS